MSSAPPLLLSALPPDLSGSSVLDIGCGFGAVAEEAALRGASKVVAVDIDEGILEIGSQRCANLSIEFVRGDVETELPRGRFDYVILHNLLHRVRHPFAVLDRVINATEQALLLQLTGLGSVKPMRLLRRDYQGDEAVRTALAAMPLALIGRNGTPARKREEKTFLSRSAVENLLLEQRRAFARVEFVDDETGENGSAVVRASRRLIDRLVVVSGPTGSGKSTLIEGLLTGSAHAAVVAEAIGFDCDVGWLSRNGEGLKLDSTINVDRMVFHYDILKPWGRDARIYERDESLDVLPGAKSVVIVAVTASAPTMIARLQAELSALDDPSTRGAVRLREVLDLYRSELGLWRWLSAWINYCRDLGADMVFVDSNEAYSLLSESEWLQMACGRGR